MTTQLNAAGITDRTRSTVRLGTLLAGVLVPLVAVAGIAVTTLRPAPLPLDSTSSGPPSSAEVLATQR